MEVTLEFGVPFWNCCGLPAANYRFQKPRDWKWNVSHRFILDQGRDGRSPSLGLHGGSWVLPPPRPRGKKGPPTSNLGPRFTCVFPLRLDLEGHLTYLYGRNSHGIIRRPVADRVLLLSNREIPLGLGAVLVQSPNALASGTLLYTAAYQARSRMVCTSYRAKHEKEPAKLVIGWKKGWLLPENDPFVLLGWSLYRTR